MAQRVSNYELAGESDIEKGFASDQNKLFVLHEAPGLEPGNLVNFNIAESFILERCEQEELSERLHAIW